MPDRDFRSSFAFNDQFEYGCPRPTTPPFVLGGPTSMLKEPAAMLECQARARDVFDASATYLRGHGPRQGNAVPPAQNINEKCVLWNKEGP